MLYKSFTNMLIVFVGFVLALLTYNYLATNNFIGGFVSFIKDDLGILSVYGLIAYFAILGVEYLLAKDSPTRSGLFLFRCCIAVLFGLAYSIRFATLYSADTIFITTTAICALVALITVYNNCDWNVKYKSVFDYRYLSLLLIALPILMMFVSPFSVVRGINTFFLISIFWEMVIRTPQVFTKAKYFDTFLFATAFLGLILYE